MLKIPSRLKARVAAAAKVNGKDARAFMLKAIESETYRVELYSHDAFLLEALVAEAEMERTGHYYAAEDVFRYARARALGKRPRRPKPKVWPNDVLQA